MRNKTDFYIIYTSRGGMCEIRDATDTVAVGSQRELGRSLDNAMARNGRWTLFQYSGSSKRTSSPGGMSTVVDLTGPTAWSVDVRTRLPYQPMSYPLCGVCLLRGSPLARCLPVALSMGPRMAVFSALIHEAANALQNRRHRVGVGRMRTCCGVLIRLSVGLAPFY